MNTKPRVDKNKVENSAIKPKNFQYMEIIVDPVFKSMLYFM